MIPEQENNIFYSTLLMFFRPRRGPPTIHSSPDYYSRRATGLSQTSFRIRFIKRCSSLSTTALPGILRVSSYEPGRPGWLGFPDLASPLFSLQKFRCVHMRRRAGPASYRDLGNRAVIFSHMNTPVRIPGLSGTKHFQLRMACKVADKSERGSTGIWGRTQTYFRLSRFSPPNADVFPAVEIFGGENLDSRIRRLVFGGPFGHFSSR